MTESYKDIPRTPISSAPSTINITGLWRIMRPVVDLEKCKKCTLCWKFCPEPCISIVDGIPVIDYDYCKGCAICAEVCPKGAIELEEEKK